MKSTTAREGVFLTKIFLIMLCLCGAFRVSAQTGNAWNTGPYCLGQTINLYSKFGTSWSWAGPNGFTSSVQDPVIPNAQAPHVGTYTVSIGQADGSFINATTDVEINTTVNLCHADAAHNFSIAPVPGAVDYQWFIDGNSSHTALLSGQATTVIVVDLTQLSDGLHDITAMVNTNSCAPPTTCLSIFLPPILQVSASNNGPFCAGETIQLLSVPTGGVEPYQFSWTGPAGFSSTDQSPARGNSTLAMSGEYFLTITDANGCTAATSTTLSVGTAPSATTSVSGNPFCIAENIQFTAAVMSGTAPFSYNWHGPNNWASNQQNPVRPSATTVMAGQYIVTVTDQTGCFDIDTLQVLVNPRPSAAASNGGPYCFGNTVQLNGSGGITYQWLGPNGYTASIANPVRFNATALMDGAYFLTVADADGCTATASTLLAISACTELCNDGIDNDGDGLVDCYDTDCINEVAVVGTAKTRCFGETATLTANGGSSYVWSTTETTQTITVSQSGIYAVTATNGQGCSATGNFSLTVHPLPLTAVANVDPICAMDTLKLHATGGLVYHWSGPGGWSAHGSDPIFPGIIGAYSGNYSVTATNEFGCEASASTAVLVNPLPQNVDAMGADITCGNAFPFITGQSSTPGTSWSWTGPAAFTSVLQTSTVGVPGTYFGRAMIPATGCFVIDSAMVGVDTAHFSLTANGGILNCQDTILRLNATPGVQNCTFAWTGPAGFSSNFQQPFTKQPGDYTVVATNPENGCTESATASVFLQDAVPSVEATGGQFDCALPSTQIFATTTVPDAKFYWTGPSGFASRKQNPVVSQGGTYTVRIVDPANGCVSLSASVVVVVIQ